MLTPDTTTPAGPPARPARPHRIHPSWLVAGVSFVALLGAAGFRSAPGVLMLPLKAEFGWSVSVVSLAVSINLVLYGLTAPFAAALMDRFGIRAVTSTALVLVATGSGLTIFITTRWQLLLLWGLLIGLGTGSMAMVFAATVANRWFVRRRGLVMGILTAAGATGQLIFLPVMARLAVHSGWREASLVVSLAALAVVPLVLVFMRNHPADRGVTPYGSLPGTPIARPVSASGPGPAVVAVRALRVAARTRTFWALVVGFAICGATTNGLIGVHFIPSAHDHDMPETTAAGLLAVVGVFDVVGTIASGALTDRINPRVLLVAYYGFRGVGLVLLPALLSATVRPSIVVFVVIYGLDWVATVPPTVALCREAFGESGTIVFGWVFAAHQLGAAAASVAAGAVRDATGQYTIAWFAAAGLCAVAALVSGRVGRSAAAVRPSAA